MKKFLSTTRESSRRTSRTKKRIGALIITAVVTTGSLWLLASIFAGLASLIATPIQVTKTWLFESSGNLPSYLRDRNALITQIDHLTQELATVDGNGYQLGLLQKENEQLRSLLGEEGEERILAGIIGRPGTIPYDVLVIDKGASDNIQENTPVYIGTDRVIGAVTKVFQNSSVVELVTTPGLVSSVFIVGPNIYTNAVGIGSGQLRIGVPQGIELAIGDSVILPAAERGVFGTIAHVESSPTQPEQFGFVSTDIPLQSLRFVAVGTQPLKAMSFEEAQEVVTDGLDALFTVPVPDGILVVPETTSTTSTTTTATSTSATTSTDSASTSASEIIDDPELL